jgi:Na+-transporting NADH:ubiquinone oxidoreductase subunit NqrF
MDVALLYVSQKENSEKLEKFTVQSADVDNTPTEMDQKQLVEFADAPQGARLACQCPLQQSISISIQNMRISRSSSHDQCVYELSISNCLKQLLRPIEPSNLGSIFSPIHQFKTN